MSMNFLSDFSHKQMIIFSKKCYNIYKCSTSEGNDYMDYKYLVKQLRAKLIITQTELAELLGVSFASINRWETGKHMPTTKIKRKIVALCKENGIKLEENND